MPSNFRYQTHISPAVIYLLFNCALRAGYSDPSLIIFSCQHYLFAHIFIFSYLLLLYVKNFRVHVLRSRLIYQPHRSMEKDKIYLAGCSNNDRDYDLDCLFVVYTLKVRSILATPLESHKLHILIIVVPKVIICYFQLLPFCITYLLI
jgi:hypothetical protein